MKIYIVSWNLILYISSLTSSCGACVYSQWAISGLFTHKEITLFMSFNPQPSNNEWWFHFQRFYCALVRTNVSQIFWHLFLMNFITKYNGYLCYSCHKICIYWQLLLSFMMKRIPWKIVFFSSSQHPERPAISILWIFTCLLCKRQTRNQHPARNFVISIQLPMHTLIYSHRAEEEDGKVFIYDI
jgi:hypothetical protein